MGSATLFMVTFCFFIFVVCLGGVLISLLTSGVSRKILVCFRS